jgi:hypothetical protein
MTEVRILRTDPFRQRVQTISEGIELTADTQDTANLDCSTNL